MAYEIRELSLAEILDTGFRLVKERFGLLAGIAFATQAPAILFFGSFDWLLDPFAGLAETMPEIGLSFAVALALYFIGILAIFPLAVAAVTSTIGDLYLGAEVSLRRAVRAGLSRYFPLLVTYFIFTVVTMVAFVLAVLLVAGVFALGSQIMQPLGALGIMIGVITGIAAFAGLMVAGLLYFVASFILAAVVVLENRMLFGAILRTWELINAERLRAAGVALTIYMIAVIPAAGVQMMVGLIPMFGALIWGAVQAIGYAFMFATSVVLYFDIRCRKEAFDLEHLAQLVEGQEPSAVAPGV
jgi:hypothetical protein